MEAKTKWILGIAVSVLLIGGGIGAYLHFKKPSSKKGSKSSGSTNDDSAPIAQNVSKVLAIAKPPVKEVMMSAVKNVVTQ